MCHRIFLIPELLEQVLVRLPIIQLATTGRAVCKLWQQSINTSPVCKYYLSTGLLPSDFSNKTFDPKSPPHLTPAASEYLGFFWHKLLRLPEQYPKAIMYLDKLEDIYIAFSKHLQDVDLFIPQPPAYRPGFFTIHGSWSSPLDTYPFLCDSGNDQLKPIVQIIREMCDDALSATIAEPRTHEIGIMYMAPRSQLERLPNPAEPLTTTTVADTSTTSGDATIEPAVAVSNPISFWADLYDPYLASRFGKLDNDPLGYSGFWGILKFCHTGTISYKMEVKQYKTLLAFRKNALDLGNIPPLLISMRHLRS
ncbi:hypothetical protein ABW20_dc0110406 [Dactylellina cionopaga]|nr:hypothetical protein ABW20_dc0110406 [Dactylellina cionopaga]